MTGVCLLDVARGLEDLLVLLCELSFGQLVARRVLPAATFVDLQQNIRDILDVAENPISATAIIKSKK